MEDDSWAYIIKRFDRDNNEKIHQEDFFQILEKRDKYEGSLEGIVVTRDSLVKVIWERRIYREIRKNFQEAFESTSRRA